MTVDFPPLRHVRAFLFDMDGVLYEGNRVLPGAPECIRALQATHTPLLMLTNNASRTPAQYTAKMASMGMDVAPEWILTSAIATARYIRSQYPGARVLPIGEIGLHEALKQEGLQVVTQANDGPDYVVVGLDTTISYAKLTEATLAVRRGVPFIATNPDKTYPSERGEVPGAGSIVAAVEAASGVQATVIGKPRPGIFHQALALLGVAAADTAMVGDRLETDIEGSRAVGILTILPMTGITTPELLAASPLQPDWVIPDLTHLTAAWEALHITRPNVA